ncbi:hypothetical protein [Acidisphaera sp. S103]|uniref:hypothetical protein n=1 Tax=Acidisphaera sp. S103 TaxID=1747223 RepID=UPI00131D5CA5|nr:hypothetical protein [Acidisphaera sp. S103]
MSQTTPQICYLSHAGFRMLGEPVFRLSEGSRIPSMVIQLDSQEAVLPLQSVAREFRVDPTSPDGQMLTLIEQALEFVVSIKLGDKLPSELNGGEASWEPNGQDRRVAASRVRHNLVRSVFARLGKRVTISGTLGWEDDPKNQEWLRQAIAGAADQLDNMEEAEVTTRVASISEEMAYIEAMRRPLTRGIANMREKLLHIDSGEVPISQQETFKQVQSLARLGIKEVMNRFDEVDVRLDDFLGVLRDIPAAIAGLRRQRDWLFRTNRAWTAVFADWEAAPKHFNEFLLRVVERTYVFLAPRFMSYQEWTTTESKLKKTTLRATAW